MRSLFTRHEPLSLTDAASVVHAWVARVHGNGSIAHLRRELHQLDKNDDAIVVWQPYARLCVELSLTELVLVEHTAGGVGPYVFNPRTVRVGTVKEIVRRSAWVREFANEIRAGRGLRLARLHLAGLRRHERELRPKTILDRIRNGARAVDRRAARAVDAWLRRSR